MPAFSDIPGIQLQILPSGSRTLHCSHAAFTASVSLEGGQLLQFTPTGQRPWLYLSPLANQAPGKAIRGGIPVCWPWFGPHATDAAAPQHGIARTAAWEVTTLAADKEGLSIELQGPEYDGLSVSTTLRLGPSLDVELVTHNRSDTTHLLGAALHTYLALGDTRHAEVAGLAGSRYDDKVLRTQARHETDRLGCAGDIDRIVYTDAVLELIDPLWQRRFRIFRRNAGCAVLWNPGAVKARALADMPDGDWTDFFCVEAAIAANDTRQLAPGETFTFGTRIECIPL
jgi:glucose-6-phosphate 1-epimerase